MTIMTANRRTWPHVTCIVVSPMHSSAGSMGCVLVSLDTISSSEKFSGVSSRQSFGMHALRLFTAACSSTSVSDVDEQHLPSFHIVISSA